MSEGIECTVDVYQKQHRPCNCKQLDAGACNRRSQKANYKAQLFTEFWHPSGWGFNLSHTSYWINERRLYNRSSKRRVIIKERSFSDLTEQISQITGIKFGSFWSKFHWASSYQNTARSTVSFYEKPTMDMFLWNSRRWSQFFTCIKL